MTTTLPSSAGVTGAGVSTALTYDADNRVLQTQQSLAGTVLRTTSATYTVTGKQANATDANGNVTRYAYDLLDRLSQTTDALGRVTQYTYDALSRPYQVFNPTIAGSIPGGALVQQTYTADGLRASLVDANNNTTGFAYDGFDRLSTTTYPDSTAETYTYDADSNVLTRKTRASSSTTFTYAYDTLNRLSTKTPVTGPVVSYAYDLAGRLTGVSDTSSAIQAIATPGTTTTYTTNYTFNALNQPVGVSFGDVPAATASPTAITPVAFSHSYNAVNQRTGQSVSDNSWLSYPGSAASTSYTANNLNQYTAVGSAAPTYDNNGNLLSDGIYSFGYDLDNRLTSASGSGMSASYAFDGRGRRKSKTVNGATVISITDADNREVLEYDGSSGAILRWYAYGLGPNDLVSQMNLGGTPTRSSFIPDMLGSVIGSQDAATGTITSFAYRAYGHSPSPPSQFGYTGQRIDTETGLYYFRSRHYHPDWGRFPQTDTIGHQGGILLYAYVTNDPINANDPFGLCDKPGGCGTTSVSASGQAFQGPMLAAPAGEAAAAGTAAARLLGPGAAITLPLALSGDTCQTCDPDVYRGDRPSLTPGTVFTIGFSPKGTNLDLLAHAWGASDSGYVATSQSLDIASNFAGKNGYVYVISASYGIDVNAALGAKSPYPEQREIAFPGGILGFNVKGVYPKQNGVLLPFVANPLYGIR